MKFWDVIVCFSIAISAISAAAADSIQGCGGFVEASRSLIKSRKQSDPKLDYSHITVELRTVDGLVKDRTQCAPNGYYFIPVYDKGSFVIKIKGPEGWSWDPDNVPVVIDQNGCNGNADINFRFTGFTLFGRVVGAVGGESCLSKEGGPSNVKVGLLSLTDELISSVFTSSVGGYSFTNIIPGKYKLRASHPNLNVEVRGSSEVELGFGNGAVGDIFFVPGYDIHGSVVAQGNPILGVHIYLYSDDVMEVSCPQGTGNSPWSESALCHAVSDADGKFTFNKIPCGAYELLPFYKGENTVFDVSPPSMNVSVEHHHITIAQKFQVTGFSVGGRVVDGNGVGVDGVRIIVDGHGRSITDSEGYYKLDQVTSKHYTISAEKDHYKFNSLENFLVLPNMASVADIKAAYYDICGIVRLTSPDHKAKVMLTHGPENVKPQVKQADDNGNFCFEVPPGDYRLSALAATKESASGLMFLPPYVDVTVNSPLLNVEFSQALVDIHGTVLCKEKCDPSISISLLTLVGRSRKERSTFTLTHESSDFMFPKVSPGKYWLEVKHASSSATSEEDNWCWKQSTIEVDVGTEGKKGISFIQKGYWTNIISTHDVDAYIRQPDSTLVNLQIKRGSQKICLESAGQHELHFVNSCIFFGSMSVKFDTLKSSPINLTGKKYLLSGEVHIHPSLDHDPSELSENIIVDVVDRNNEVIDVSRTRVRSNGNDQTGTAIFEYSIWANLGDELIFAPRDSRVSDEKKFLFYPRRHHVSISTAGCQATIPPFVGRPGLYIEGSVSPALSDVDIRIVAAGESVNAPLLKGELALETKTGVDGSFIGGPLYDDTNYRVEASKPGYHLKPIGSNSFSCQKLSQISVLIYAGEEAEELFPSVLLSLSGEDGYRNNSITGAGGSFFFDYLFPGSFYLRPLLKEYSFSPPAQAIELGSGESKEVVFHATRVAYSAMGTISLLSGQPKEGVSVEARSDSKGLYEETVTDSSGNYRLRGLLPDTSYAIKVKDDLGSIKIERASPQFVAVEVGSEDIKGLDFVVFEQPEITILSGYVEGTGLDELQPHLSVEIRSVDDPSKVESVLPLPLSYFFQIRDLPKAKHLVLLKSGLSSSTHKFESEIIEVDLEKQPQVHVGPLRYKVQDIHQKMDLTPAPVFPLIGAVCVIALFISLPRLKDLYQLTVGITPLGSSTTSVKKEVRKPAVRKRTY
ncbi:hypothetical protein MRB53_031931 [Persea americana]|uniref:Uncharacterized protein n=1 Tax=Persea americana TaxID=3435 RepID=A0ACC2KRJ8_PERAE|nr:hypothetical protein MRB53_031931 [Persea americana]|eukprot:TRINITY_DN22601_c2_g3_i1.p1 TRINITY_DN22601_c2_g3~~TRINITY_DN22601_c2_g3_i1.p1  ORF type:complete len:1199 (-),score=262.07 TRINITY_DN22601_c2_g3_i1:437-4033(-)